ncbi:MAG: biotin--[acetyl-CoA-carboxylase] ligase [Oscillospiraceae bacterium]
MDNKLALTEKGLMFHIKQYKMKRKLTFLSETTSTNDVAKRLCNENKGVGTMVIADSQTEGRGRLSRSFCSPKGIGAYISIIYEVTGSEKSFDLLSSLAGLAVRDSLYNMFGLDCKIKWPNDIILNDKKLCGILCEIINVNNRPKYVSVGIGLNIESFEFPDELQYTAISIADVYKGEIDHNELCIEIVNNLDRYVLRSKALLNEENFEIINNLKKYSSVLDKMVRVVKPDEEFDARVLDLDKNGGLIIKTSTETTTLTSGEIIHLR